MPKDNRSGGRREARTNTKRRSNTGSGKSKSSESKSSEKSFKSSGRKFSKSSADRSEKSHFGPRKSSGGRRGERSFEEPNKSFRKGGGNSRTRKGAQERKAEKTGFFDKKVRNVKSGKRIDQSLAAPVQTEKIRLNKFIANSGVCSRREADELIAMGLISVNGKTITELGYKVNPGDEVRYENKVLRAEKPVYLLLNKPKGYLTTTDDPQERNTVMHIIGSAVKERIYPVGRLDRNTTGLLLLTNDGDLADKLMHPSYNVKKIYKVELDRPLTKADFQTILDGVKLEEGKATVDDLAIISDDGKTIGVELHIGWNRVVRRIFETLNYKVIKLDRSVYAGLDKKDLARGHWRFLTKEEVIMLKHFK
jgi:23S rRNA pseudouridine2605 synthase